MPNAANTWCDGLGVVSLRLRPLCKPICFPRCQSSIRPPGDGQVSWPGPCRFPPCRFDFQRRSIKSTPHAPKLKMGATVVFHRSYFAFPRMQRVVGHNLFYQKAFHTNEMRACTSRVPTSCPGTFNIGRVSCDLLLLRIRPGHEPPTSGLYHPERQGPCRPRPG